MSLGNGFRLLEVMTSNHNLNVGNLCQFLDNEQSEIAIATKHQYAIRRGHVGQLF